MKRIFGGLVAVLTVLGYADANGECASCSSCASCGKRVQTIRITAGNKSQQYVVDEANGMAVARAVNADGGANVSDGQSNRSVGYDFAEQASPQGRVATANYVYPDNQRVDDRYAGDMDALERDYYYASPRYADAPRGTVYGDEGKWYIGARLDLNFLSWKNKYRAFPADSIDGDPNADHDDYSFEPVLGGDIFAGYRFNQSWRADLEFGFTSDFSDSGRGFTFEMSAPYLMANGYYDFANGLYLGLGVGLAFPKISMDWTYFVDDDSSKTKVSLAGAAMFGYAYHLSDALILDLRYRFSGFNGPTLTREADDPYHPQLEWVKTKVGFMMDNTLSVGIRYEF